MKKIAKLFLLSVSAATFSLYAEKAIATSCNDFYCQEFAQDFFYSNSNYDRELDSDRNSWVGEYLARQYSALTKKTWNELLYRNRQRKMQSNNKLSLTYTEVNQIIGFYPNNKLKNGRHVWEDPIDGKRIEIRFRDGRIAQMKAVGF